MNAAARALALVLGGDAEVVRVIALTLAVSGGALAISCLTGIPLGAWVGLSRGRGTRLVQWLLYTGMGLPPVVVGLFVYLMLSRQGPFGGLGWLFTPTAMVIAQTGLAFPLAAGLTAAAVRGVPREFAVQVRSLGASPWQERWAIVARARRGVLAAVIAAFGGCVSEVGAAMLVGGNIHGRTRVLTTTIVQETRQGNFELALALGIVLLGVVFVANGALLALGRTRRG